MHRNAGSAQLSPNGGPLILQAQNPGFESALRQPAGQLGCDALCAGGMQHGQDVKDQGSVGAGVAQSAGMIKQNARCP